MSDTPRTDAVAWPLEKFLGDASGGYVLGSFARQLERELTVMTDKYNHAKAGWDYANTSLDALRKANG